MTAVRLPATPTSHCSLMLGLIVGLGHVLHGGSPCDKRKPPSRIIDGSGAALACSGFDGVVFGSHLNTVQLETLVLFHISLLAFVKPFWKSAAVAT